MIEATLLELLPIVMTSLAFGFGALPSAIASGAGAYAQAAIGTDVLGDRSDDLIDAVHPAIVHGRGLAVRT
jgi:hypothetical protein